MVAERPAVALSVMVYCMVISWCFGAGPVLGVLLCMCPVGSVSSLLRPVFSAQAATARTGEFATAFR